MGLFNRKKNWIALDATVISVRMTKGAERQTDKRNLSHDFELEIPVEGGEPRRIIHRCTVPWDKVPIQGASLPLRIDPTDPVRLEVDWTRATSVLDQARAARGARDSSELAAAFGFEVGEGESEPAPNDVN